jgi:hypothetical protein
LYSSPSIIRMIKSRRIRWAGHVAHTWEKRNIYRILIRKPEGKRVLGRPSRKSEINNKMVVSGIWWGGMDWIDLPPDRAQWRALVNTVMNFRIPWNIRKFMSNWATGGLSREAQLHGVT